MAKKNPFWEICKSTTLGRGGSAGPAAAKTETQWWARLKSPNGRTVVTTETYARKGSVTNAINVVDPDSKFEVKEEVVEVEETAVDPTFSVPS